MPIVTTAATSASAVHCTNVAVAGATPARWNRVSLANLPPGPPAAGQKARRGESPPTHDHLWRGRRGPPNDASRVRWLSEVLGRAIAVEVIPVGEGIGVVRRRARVRMHRGTVRGLESGGQMMRERDDFPARRSLLRCERSAPSRAFWAEALRWEIDDETRDEIGLVPTDGTRFRIVFLPVPEQKAGKNRIHLDLTTTSIDDQQETVARLVELGARHIDVGQGPDDDHVVLADPEGNEFCVIEPENTFLAGCGRLGSITCDGTREVGILLERSARMAVGLGSGRRDRDPRAGRHRSVHHLGSAARPEDREEPAPSRHRSARPRRSASGGRPPRLARGDVESTSAKARSSWVVMADPDGNEFCVLSPR